MMEEEDQLMEDLFGGPEHVDIPAAPPVKGLAQKLDDLASSNCCQCVIQPARFIFLSFMFSNRFKGKLPGPVLVALRL